MAVCFDPRILRGTQVRYIPLRSDSSFHVPRKAVPLSEEALDRVLDEVRRRASVAQHYAQPMYWAPPHEYFDTLVPGSGVADLATVAAQLEHRLRRTGLLLYQAVACHADALMGTVVVRVWLSRATNV